MRTYIGVLTYLKNGAGRLSTNSLVDEQMKTPHARMAVESTDVGLFIHVKKNNLEQYESGRLVEFDAIQLKGKLFANNVRPLQNEGSSLSLALRYRGQYAKITYVQQNEEKMVMILPEVVKSISENLPSEKVRKILANEISKLPQDQWQAVVEEMTRSSKTLSELASVYLSSSSYEVADGDVITILIQNHIANLLLKERGALGVLELPSWFPLRPFVIPFLNVHVVEIPDQIQFVVQQLQKTGRLAQVVESSDLSDAMLLLVFGETGDGGVLNRITNFEDGVEWILGQSDWVVGKFLWSYLRFEKKAWNGRFEVSRLTSVIKAFPEERRLEFIREFLDDSRLEMVWASLYSDEAFNAVVNERLSRLEASIKYCVFDLESDGDAIREFAYISEWQSGEYEGEKNLSELFRVLRQAKLIVGHNVKKWDLGVVLKGKGFTWDAFVWDTLEIEILLDPCRYAYSLHTTHKAADDVDLTDKLFWNQLLRLSQRPELCDKLASFLPVQIKELLGEINKSWFEFAFKKEDRQFFNELNDIGHEIASSFDEIDKLPKNERTVVVASKNLWCRIAQACEVRFLEKDGDTDYCIIDREKLLAEPLEDPYLQMVMLRFTESSVTPIVANLAQYLRVNYFPDRVLQPYLSSSKSLVECCDVDALDRVSDTHSVRHLYFVGCELGNRLHQYELDLEYSISDFLDRGCWLPLKASAIGYCAASAGDLEKMSFDGLPTDARNVWIERRRDGKFKVCYAYDYVEKMKAFASHCPQAADDVKTFKWTLGGSGNQDVKRKVFLARTGEMPSYSSFDPVLKRVGEACRNRVRYWVYQMKFLCEIRSRSKGTAMVYVIENEWEVTALERYAERLGFSVPRAGSLFARLDLASRRENSLLIIAQDEFDSLVSIRYNQPICYVWDCMSVDKCRIKWDGLMPFGDEASLKDENETAVERAANGVSAIDCMRSVWSLFEYRYCLITANCAESSLYVLEPFLEDYANLEESWSAIGFLPTLWKSQDEYNADVKVCEECLGRLGNTEVSLSKLAEEFRVEDGKNAIRRMFLGENGHWRGSQESVLSAVLSQKNDCLVSIPTGGGKSILFQGPALYKAMQTERVSVVITPLKALMSDQVEGLHKRGFLLNVDCLNGDKTRSEIRQILRRLANGEIALLYVTPERFRSRVFLEAFHARIADNGGWEYFIFDEAHCISQWGQEFRPEYLNVMRLCKGWKSHYPANCITFYSATVTKQIEEDIRMFLPELQRIGESIENYNPIREHIGIQFARIDTVEDSARVRHIVDYVKDKHPDWTKSCMIVFCRTRAQCEEVADSLANVVESEERLGLRSDDIAYFHAGMNADERNAVYENFRDGAVKLLCATKAFGMGMDIPNIHYVLHYSPPQVLEDYLQEVGRAGRSAEMCQAAGFGPTNVLPAECMCSQEDFRKMKSLLCRHEMSWNDLRELLKAIRGYFLKVQSIEDTKKYPIVVPNTVWRKIDDEGMDVMFRLGLYWLETLGRIKLGFLSPVHLNIVLMKEDLTDADSMFTGKQGWQSWKVYEFVRKCVLQPTRYRDVVEDGSEVRSCVQVSVTDLRRTLQTSRNMALSALINCVNKGALRLEQDSRGEITKLRNDEVEYVLKERYEAPALHMMFEVARKLLEKTVAGRGFVRISPSEFECAVNEALEECKARIGNTLVLHDRLVGNGRNRQNVPTLYFPWYKPEETGQNHGYLIVENYVSDFRKRRARHAFALMEMLKGVSCRTGSDLQTGDPWQNVWCSNRDWGKQLEKMEVSCLKALEYVHGLRQPRINFADAVPNICPDEGFRTLEDILTILAWLGYVKYESLLPVGVEMLATDRTVEDVEESPDANSSDAQIKNEFESLSRLREIRLAAMEAFSKLEGRASKEFITEYFRCSSEQDFLSLLQTHLEKEYPSLLRQLRAEALKVEEERLSEEQRQIYMMDPRADVNVLAGPGSGKTHILALRCARLIYRDRVHPEQLLVLAYNRAVVVELRNRLNNLFRKLGMSASASRLHVYTFHQLAKKVCGGDLEGLSMKEWEGRLLDVLKKKPNQFRLQIGGSLRYVLIDEFQDITQTRLDAILELKDVYSSLSFFTIGDKNQSIYGFDRRPDPVSPTYYYDELRRSLPNLVEPTMRMNFRSYQQILDAAGFYLADRNDLPKAVSTARQEKLTTDNTVTIVDTRTRNAVKWWDDLPRLVERAKEEKYRDVALFFRTNQEVFRGYGHVKRLNLPDVRIRIQGSQTGELYRTREFSEVVRHLERRSSFQVCLEGQKTERVMRRAITRLMLKHPNWDRFYLDLAFTLVLDYLEFISSEAVTFTYGDLAEFIKDVAGADDGQLYKIYDKYQGRRIDNDSQLNLVLTTMHKVKGLEFDAVIITPSFAALPLGLDSSRATLAQNDEEDIEEERRLMYVAYTRAKKMLRVYKWKREYALDGSCPYAGEPEDVGKGQLGISERNPGLENYNLGFNAGVNFWNDAWIADNVRKNASVEVRRVEKRGATGQAFFVHNIYVEGRVVGQLSRNSHVKTAMDASQTSRLVGFFVSDIFVWSYEDSKRSDERNGTKFSTKWCENARKKGFVHVVSIAGYGHV